MKTANFCRFGIHGAVLAAAIGGASVHAAGSFTEQLVRIYSDPDEFVLTRANNEKQLRFEQNRELRICVGQQHDNIQLLVQHDGQTTPIHPGQCQRFNAKTYSIKPAQPLADNWNLTGSFASSSAAHAVAKTNAATP